MVIAEMTCCWVIPDQIHCVVVEVEMYCAVVVETISSKVVPGQTYSQEVLEQIYSTLDRVLVRTLLLISQAGKAIALYLTAVALDYEQVLLAAMISIRTLRSSHFLRALRALGSKDLQRILRSDPTVDLKSEAEEDEFARNLR